MAQLAVRGPLHEGSGAGDGAPRRPHARAASVDGRDGALMPRVAADRRPALHAQRACHQAQLWLGACMWHAVWASWLTLLVGQVPSQTRQTQALLLKLPTVSCLAMEWMCSLAQHSHARRHVPANIHRHGWTALRSLADKGFGRETRWPSQLRPASNGWLLYMQPAMAACTALHQSRPTLPGGPAHTEHPPQVCLCASWSSSCSSRWTCRMTSHVHISMHGLTPVQGSVSRRGLPHGTEAGLAGGVQQGPPAAGRCRLGGQLQHGGMAM